MMSIRNRTVLVSVLLPAAVLAGLALLFFNRMAFSNLILARGDTFLYFYPYWHAAAAALGDARVPFWNPAIFMGAPMLANSQTGFFYPLNWPLWLLLETPYAVSATILLHIFVAGLGTYLLGWHVLSLSATAALVAAASFAFGGYLTAQVEHINQLQGLAWLPWFLLVIGLVSNGNRRSWLLSMLAAGGLFAMQLLAGHTQTTFITALGVLIWIVADWLGRRFLPGLQMDGKLGRDDLFFSPFTALIAGGLLAIALAAIQLLPTLELMQYSSRAGGLPANEAMSFSLPPHLLATALLPAYGRSFFTEYVTYLPLVVLALAFIGGWQWRNRQGVIPSLVLAVGGLFLALGAYNPVYWLLARLPGFSLFRAPARWLVLYALGLSLLAGIGWHLLWQWAGDKRDEERCLFFRRKIAPPLLLFFAAIPLLAIWGFAAGYFVDLVPLGPEAPFEQPSTLTLGGWILEALLLGVLMASAANSGTVRIRRIALSGLLFVGLIAGFLASRSLPYNNLTTPEAFFDLRPSTSRLLAESRQAPDRMLSLSDIFFDPGDQAEIDSIYSDQLSEQARYDYTVAIKEKEINAPNLPMIIDLASVDGFDGGILPLRAYTQLMRVLMADGQETTDGRLREHLDAVPEAHWLDLFNARYLLTDKTGDVWHGGMYYDRQHPVVLAEGETASVSFLPQFEATEIRLLATAQPEAVHIVTEAGDGWTLVPQLIEDSLYQVVFPRPAILTETTIDACSQDAACTLEGLSLVDTRDGTFFALVPGNYRLLHSGDVKIYENSDVLPRAFLVHDWQIVSDSDEGIAAMLEPGFDVRSTAVIEQDPAQPELDAGEIQIGDPGQAHIEAYSPEQVVLRTDSPAGGLLVLTDAFYPSWTATLDGDPVFIYRADGMFRGVFVPEGQHEVVFQYNSALYRLGLIVFIFTLVIIAIVLVKLLLRSHKKL